jgi:hypothetical protein
MSKLSEKIDADFEKHYEENKELYEKAKVNKSALHLAFICGFKSGHVDGSNYAIEFVSTFHKKVSESL